MTFRRTVKASNPNRLMSISQSIAALRRIPFSGIQAVPGLAITATLALAAFGLAKLPQLALISPVVLAFCLGICLRSILSLNNRFDPGIVFASRGLLRSAIAFLGIQLTLPEIITLGPGAIIICTVALVATFVFTSWLGVLLRVDRGLSELLAAGTAVCGAAAIVAMNSTTRASESDVAYALASITFFGTIAIFLLPIGAAGLGMPQVESGLWAGSSIHEVAQVAAAATQIGPDATLVATMSKLVRVLLLAPLIIVVRMNGPRVANHPSSMVPWFIILFVALALLGSALGIEPETKQTMGRIVGVIFAMSLAAMGLMTDLRPVVTRGWRPLALTALASIFIAVLSFVLVCGASHFGLI